MFTYYKSICELILWAKNNRLHERIYLVWFFHDILSNFEIYKKRFFLYSSLSRLYWQESVWYVESWQYGVVTKILVPLPMKLGRCVPKVGIFVTINAWILKSRIQNLEFWYSFQSDCIVLRNLIDFSIVSKFCWLGKGSRSEAKLWWKNKHMSVSVAPPLIEARLS